MRGLISESDLDLCIDIMEEFDKYLDSKGVCMMINETVWTPSSLLRVTNQTVYIAKLLMWISGEPNVKFERVKKRSSFRAARRAKAQGHRQIKRKVEI